jgi:hypothetical protein
MFSYCFFPVVAKDIPEGQKLFIKYPLWVDYKLIVQVLKKRSSKREHNKTLSKWKGLFPKWYCLDL